jgi:hypothetical protein
MKELTIYSKIENPMQAVEKMGKFFTASGMFGCKNEAQGMVLAMACLAEQKNPLQIIAEYHIIDGKLTKRADSMHADFLRSGGRITWIRSTEEECSASFVHSEFSPKPTILTLTKSEMVNSGVATGKSGQLKDNWRKFPRQMLRARIISEGVRMINPGLISGIYTPEEVSDFSPDAIIEAHVESAKEEQSKPEQPEPEPSKNDKKTWLDKVLAYFTQYEVTIRDLEAYVGKACGEPPKAHHAWDKGDKELIRDLKEQIEKGDTPERRIEIVKGLINV